MEAGLINQGLVLMLAGMGTVFVFLTLLVIVMTIMAKILVRFHVIEAVDASAGATPEEVAAITAAIAAHRQR